MKTIVAGSRSITNPALVDWCIAAADWEVTEIVCGMCQGPDMFGREWAVRNGIAVAEFPADWRPARLYGRVDRQAGYRRNGDMAIYADALIAVWDGKSNGTKHMIKCARQRDLQVFVHNVFDYFTKGFQTS